MASVELKSDGCNSASGTPPFSATDWKRLVLPFQQPCTRRAAWQMVNTLGLYAALWAGMYAALPYA